MSRFKGRAGSVPSEDSGEFVPMSFWCCAGNLQEFFESRSITVITAFVFTWHMVSPHVHCQIPNVPSFIRT